jgi:hypothetical protein
MIGIDLDAVVSWIGFCIVLNVIVAMIAAFLRRWGAAAPDLW